MSSLHSLSTTRRGRAGLAVAAVLAAVTPLATACGAGFDSAALAVKPDAGAGVVGNVKINNVWVVVDPASGNAEVIGSMSNGGSTDVSWPTVQVNGSSAQIQAASGTESAVASTGIPAGESVSFGLPGQPQIELTGSGLTAGNLTPVSFDFGSAGNLTVTAQIQPNSGLFAEYNPNPMVGVPGGSASASASASAGALVGAGASPSGNATSSTSASASATASASASASPSAS